MNFRREAWLTRVLMAATVLSAGMALWEIAAIASELGRSRDWFGVATQAVFALAFLALIAGGLAYQLARIGYLERRRSHTCADRESLEAHFSEGAPTLAILVPAYKEEPAVVRRTMLSAALQSYPNRRIVLLIDDPCRPTTRADAANLQAMRELPATLRRAFGKPAEFFELAHRDYCRRSEARTCDGVTETANLSRLYGIAADFLEQQEIAACDAADHSDALLAQDVLTWWRRQHRERATRFMQLAQASRGLEPAVALQEYRRLATLFRVDFDCFERKLYENLSHEANKAMNLNSYLALMGRSFRQVKTDGARSLRLEPAPAGAGTMNVPDATFVITLDADSVLLPDYALRLIHLMTRPGNERIAVAQTPYSAFPSAPGLLERIAGAQTDIQYLMHQGFTRYRATFWVGANAVLRKAALEDIASEHLERGHRVTKYIQDRTVIEDTESSIDLVDREWGLHNYPERLAYSATPPDFGSLLIQRHRWANGGLIILPKALRYLKRGALTGARIAEAFLRVHYLASVAATSIAFLLIIFGPFERNLYIAWVPLTMLPYMLAYVRDLVHCGYRWTDFPRVYSLNLLLLPICLGGTMRSLHQAITGKRAPFGRTPKVTGRTAAHGAYVMAEYALLGGTAVIAGVHIIQESWLSASLSGIYVTFMGYGILRYIGLRESAADLRLWIGAFFASPAPRSDRPIQDRKAADSSTSSGL